MSVPSTVVAREFLRLGQESGRPLTPLELIKLTYIAHGWSLGIRGTALVSEQAQAWQYGPVFPTLYHALKSFRASPVTYVPKVGGELYSDRPLSDSDKALISSVFNAYRGLNGVQLSNLTHQPNTPWAKTWDGRSNAPISDELIRAHYIELGQQRRAS